MPTSLAVNNLPNDMGHELNGTSRVAAQLTGSHATSVSRRSRVRLANQTGQDDPTHSPIDEYQVLADQVRKARALVSGVFLLLAVLSLAPVFLEREVQVTVLIGLALFAAGTAIRLYVGHVQESERQLASSGPSSRRSTRSQTAGWRWRMAMEMPSRHSVPATELRYLQVMQRLSMVDRDFTPQDYDVLLELDAGNSHMREFLQGASQDTIDTLPCYPYKDLMGKTRSDTCMHEVFSVGADTQTAQRDDASCASTDADRSRTFGTNQQAKLVDTEQQSSKAIVVPEDTLRKKLDANEQACVVCLEVFREEEAVRILPCFHQFHRTCIDPWLRQQAKCPICKAHIM